MLKDGSEVEDPRLDRLYELDWRSLNYPITAQLEAGRAASGKYRLDVPANSNWDIKDLAVLDQGPDGACVGFAFAQDLPVKPQTISMHEGNPIDGRFAKERVYWESQKIDEWDGGSYPGATPAYEGTSILAGAKVMTNQLRFYGSYYWALDIRQLILGVSHYGPCIFGINWYQGMFTPDRRNFIAPSGAVAGGHAVLIYGIQMVYKKRGPIPVKHLWNFVDHDRSYVSIKNSWGPNWGDRGRCYMTLRNVNRLLNEQGDACFPRRVAA